MHGALGMAGRNGGGFLRAFQIYAVNATTGGKNPDNPGFS